jgi:hypothetical protein
MLIRKMRLLLSKRSELGAAREIMNHNNRKQLNDSIMKAGRAHRRRSFRVPDRSTTTAAEPRKEVK